MAQNRTIDLTSIGGIKFEEDTHKYTNAQNVVYKGVTTLLKRYEHEFDNELGSLNSAIKEAVINNFGKDKFEVLKRDCKQVGLKILKENVNLSDNEKTEQAKHTFGHSFLYTKYDSIIKKYPNLELEIKDSKVKFLKNWKQASDDSITIGSAEHDRREQDIKENGYFYEGVHYKYIEGKNILNVSKDDIIVIPECLVWNHKVKLGGLADIFLFNKGIINVHDYKTNEAIEMESFMGKKMKGVCNQLMDSSYFHYSLQLRIYQQMALDLRPDLNKGENFIIHTKSEKYKRDSDNLIKCFNVEFEVGKIFEELYSLN